MKNIIKSHCDQNNIKYKIIHIFQGLWVIRWLYEKTGQVWQGRTVEAVCTVHQPGGIVALVAIYMDRFHELFTFWVEL